MIEEIRLNPMMSEGIRTRTGRATSSSSKVLDLDLALGAVAAGPCDRGGRTARRKPQLQDRTTGNACSTEKCSMRERQDRTRARGRSTLAPCAGRALGCRCRGRHRLNISCSYGLRRHMERVCKRGHPHPWSRPFLSRRENRLPQNPAITPRSAGRKRLGRDTSPKQVALFSAKQPPTAPVLSPLCVTQSAHNATLTTRPPALIPVGSTQNAAAGTAAA